MFDNNTIFSFDSITNKKFIVKPIDNRKKTITCPQMKKTVFIDDDVKEFVVNIPGGNIHIEGTESNEASVELLWHPTSVLPGFEVTNNILTLQIKKKSCCFF